MGSKEGVELEEEENNRQSCVQVGSYGVEHPRLI